jgi:hypothetical protein
MTQMSLGVESMLSLDMTEYTIFWKQDTTHRTTDHPVSDITMSTSNDIIQKQQEIIQEHKRKIEELTRIIQSMKDDTSKKMDQLEAMISVLTPNSGKTVTKRRP